MSTRVRTCLWFETGGEKAAEFYVSLIPNSSIVGAFSPGPDKPPLLIEFTLDGMVFQILNGGPQFKLNEAASIVYMTPDQVATDRLWSALSDGGGETGPCGWVKDRFGVWWQIVPEALPRLLCHPDPAASARVMAAMMAMSKIDIAGLERAAAGG